MVVPVGQGARSKWNLASFFFFRVGFSGDDLGTSPLPMLSGHSVFSNICHIQSPVNILW